MTTKTEPGSRGRLRILVLTGDHSLPDPTKWDGGYTEDDLALHAELERALRTMDGYSFELLTEHSRLIERLRNDPPDLVLNFCDTGFQNVATQELHVPALLEMLGIPYTGAPPASMVLCYDKAAVRLIAESLDIPTPSEIFLPPGSSLDEADLFFPALIKPAQGDGSVGIRSDAVVRTVKETRAYLRWFREALPERAALFQEFLPGREYGMALVGNPGFELTAFPALEVDYAELPERLAPILAFESKTGPDAAYGSIRIKQAELRPASAEEMRRYSLRLFERLQCRDYARFDFRTAADGRIKLLEVNPNPAWSCEAKLAQMARFAGKSYPELLGMILDSARRRYALA